MDASRQDSAPVRQYREDDTNAVLSRRFGVA
jgi:hypothetical protein